MSMSKLTKAELIALNAELGAKNEALNVALAQANATVEMLRNKQPAAKQPGEVVREYTRGDGARMQVVRVGFNRVAHREVV